MLIISSSWKLHKNMNDLNPKGDKSDCIIYVQRKHG